MKARMSARLAGIPTGLVALLTLVTVIGLAWALVVPPWQVPDENTHFAYVQTLVENGSLPSSTRKHTSSSDQRVADATVGATRAKFYPAVSPPNWSKRAWSVYQSRIRSHPLSRSDGGGPSASTNPPLFYLYAAIPYLLDRGGTAFGQLYAMRIWSVLLLDLTTVAAWLLAGEVFGRRRRSLQLVVAATSALMPMSTFMSTAVNPDALLIALWTLALWLGARVIRHGAQTADTLALCAVGACAVLTKGTSYALFFPILAAFLAAWRLAPASERRATLMREAKALPVLVLPIIAWLLIARAIGFAAVNQIPVHGHGHAVTITGFLDYLWQFYLPRLPFMPVARLHDDLPVFVTWSAQGLGEFGLLAVQLPEWAYGEAELLSPFIAAAVLGLILAPGTSRTVRRLLFATTVAVVILRAVGEVQYTASITALALLGILLAAAAAGLRRRTMTERSALLVYLSSAVFGLLLLLHATDYLVFARERIGFMEGRYLLPIVSVFGLGVALIVKRVPGELRPTVIGLAFAALLGLQFVSLSTVLHAYYT